MHSDVLDFWFSEIQPSMWWAVDAEFDRVDGWESVTSVRRASERSANDQRHFRRRRDWIPCTY